ncbi:hypothetical protein HNQ07_004162 [Deinococcus metalli]|uniref:Uncharacterized protein n=1 Tax=Deinococcus metalli TaxID=1141878 RepID=A0A7W8KI91_9DEIO|nr:hypothetical protein [Deinococcus metalli]MBB5378655.1 hypothetical protein [Deinococcus metalli]GHF61455.1 hypothetical protein GCM10017781_42030 [Deinococcus metalli]
MTAQDNEDDSTNGGIAAALMPMASSRDVHLADEAQRFEDQLAAGIEQQLAITPDDTGQGRCAHAAPVGGECHLQHVIQRFVLAPGHAF